jgi:hypothetical protein
MKNSSMIRNIITFNFFVLITISTAACGQSVGTGTNNSSENSQATVTNNSGYSNQEKAIALAMSGCSGGYIDNLSSDVDNLYPRLWHGVVIEYFTSRDGLDIYDLENAPAEDASKYAIWQLDEWHSNYMEKSFAAAKTLDERWLDLYNLWMESKQYAVNEFNNGKDSLEAAISTGDKYSISMEPICKVAILEGEGLALQENLLIPAWVQSVAGKLLPPNFNVT